MRMLMMFMGFSLFFTTNALQAQIADLIAGGGNDENAPTRTGLKLIEPFGVDFDASGNMYVAEMTAHRIKKISPQGKVEQIAGTGEKGFGGDGGPALQAKLNGPHHLMMGPEGMLLIADTWNGAVRSIDLKSGIIRTVAGTGVVGYSGDGGPATKAQFGGVYSIAMNASMSKLYIADLENRRVRVVDWKSGLVSTLAGNGKKGIPEEGSIASEQPLVDPRAVAVDSKGNVYVLERGGHALRVVDASGKIKTVVGTGGKGYSGDGGDALQATMNGPKHIAIDRDDSVLILDTENHVLRRYQPKNGRIDRIAGVGKQGAGLGTAGTSLELFRPHGIFVASDQSLYISDSSNGRVLRLKVGR